MLNPWRAGSATWIEDDWDMLVVFLAFDVMFVPWHQNHQIRAPNGGHQTAKQHGLAGSRDPFLNHISPSPGGKTSRLDPLKNCTLLVQALRVPCKTH